jgi:LysR family transcriptional activator of mexEF-oprN operon
MLRDRPVVTRQAPARPVRTPGRDLDLNLLRVFVVVAELGSVTRAAAQLYLTQPAVSAALRRLTASLGARLFARQGRGLVLTSRGTRLLAEVGPHLRAVVDAAVSPSAFDPRTSERALRLGSSDAAESWLVPELLRVLAREAPHMRLVVVPVQFRTVGDAIAGRRVDVAVTVADELPSSVRRATLFLGGFVCLFDPRHVRFGKTVREVDYFAHEHVIVSYNGDLRGFVEDIMQKTRRVRCSVSSFTNVGAIVDDSALVATVPALVAEQIRLLRPHLRAARLPFEVPKTPMELLWATIDDDDAAGEFLRAKIVEVAQRLAPEASSAVAPRIGGESRRVARPRSTPRARASGPREQA